MMEAWGPAASDVCATARLARRAPWSLLLTPGWRDLQPAVEPDRRRAMERSHAAAPRTISKTLAGAAAHDHTLRRAARRSCSRDPQVVRCYRVRLGRAHPSRCACRSTPCQQPSADKWRRHSRRDRGYPAVRRRADRPHRAFRSSMKRWAEKSGGLSRDRRQFPISNPYQNAI